MYKRQPYTYDFNSLVSVSSDYMPIVLTETNIMMPYPETDVIQNPAFNKEPVDFDFNEYK